ncbi:MAG: hypothetical protein HY556_02840 [Euryarchaeota archaeon]|nr:hypothetical protein [Euryarchaeota archaeon]
MTRFEEHEGKLHIDGKPVLKGWESATGWHWFATEDHGEDVYVVEGREVPGREYFGLVQGQEEEWGYWTTAEMDPLMERGKVWEIKKHDLPCAGRRD